MRHIIHSAKSNLRHRKLEKHTLVSQGAQDRADNPIYKCRTQKPTAPSHKDESSTASRELLLSVEQSRFTAIRTLTTDIMRSVLDAAFAGGVHLAYSDNSFRHFDGKRWSTLSEVELGRVILHHLPVDVSNAGRRIREVSDLLKMHRAIGPSPSRFDEPLAIVNVANGELWIAPDGSVEHRPHDPASNQDYCLDVIYDPAAICPLYDRALTEIFSASTSPAALVAFWHEFTGYILQPSRPDARIFVGCGQGNDGKSALVGLFVHLLGRDRVAALPVGELATNRFMLGHLADKSLFLDDDVAVGTVLPDGLLKTISEAKVVTGEAKNRDPFEFQVRAVPMLLCNAVPHLRDTSYGFNRRLTVIPFERRFTAAEADRTLFPRIRAAELPGVLNRALKGLQRVARRGWKFDPPEAVARATEEWWAEATRSSSTGSDAVQRGKRAVRGLRLPPRLSGTSSYSASADGRATPDSLPASGAHVRVTVALPQTGEGCAVKVMTSGATAEVCIEGEAARGRAPGSSVLLDGQAAGSR